MLNPEEPEDPQAVEARINAIIAANVGKHPWECEVDVYLQPEGSNPLFYVETCLEMDGDDRIIFRNRRRPGFIIKFRLHDELRAGYRFPEDPRQAVWSHVGHDCPEEAVWGVFRPFAVEDGGLTLKVYNENPKPRIGHFQYTLRVRNGAGVFVDLDPGGTNQNGNSN